MKLVRQLCEKDLLPKKQHRTNIADSSTRFLKWHDTNMRKFLFLFSYTNLQHLSSSFHHYQKWTEINSWKLGTLLCCTVSCQIRQLQCTGTRMGWNYKQWRVFISNQRAPCGELSSSLQSSPIQEYTAVMPSMMSSDSMWR